MSVIRKSLIEAVTKAIKGGDDLQKVASAPGSRLERLGTIYSRVTGLIRGKVYAKADIPLWYHVYQAYPPKYQPAYGRPPIQNIKIKQILYPEDKLRAQMPEREPINFFSNVKTESQKKVEEFRTLKKNQPNESDESIINLILPVKSSVKVK